MRVILCMVLMLMMAQPFARIENHLFENRDQEMRYKELIDQLRCLVCQNQNIADSNAELAQDLRRQAYEMVIAGKSNEEIYTYMVERYGDFVLYQPPLRRSTWLLWVGPFVILGIGVMVLVGIIRRRSRAGEEVLSEAEIERAEKLLSSGEERS